MSKTGTYYYKAFGFTIGSQLDFQWPLEAIQSPLAAACEILRSSDPAIESGWDLFYRGAPDQDTLQPKIKVFSSRRGILLSYPGRLHFEILPDKIIYFMEQMLDRQIFEPLLFRVVFVLWLELIGLPVLHASGVVIRDSAIGFLANSATGKSTLAAAFVRGGAKFLTDDIFPVEAQIHGYQARPSYAWLRLLPEVARALGYSAGEDENADVEKPAIRLDKNFGEFCSDPSPLAALYLPVRRDGVGTVSIETLPSKQAYLGLLRHSFLGSWLVRSPWHARQMDFFANLVKKIPIKQLIYPSGYEHLPDVVEAVNRDLGL